MSRSNISRRTVLRGLGAALSLPMLEAMSPTARAAAGDKPPTRMAFLYVPNGMHMPDWTPEGEGANFKLGSILKPVEAHKEYMTVLSGLTLNGARALGDGGGDHARSVASYLTGAHPKKTDGADIKNGPSIDQYAAGVIGKHTRLPSLELGTERSAQAGRCDSGYSCAYTSNMSWRTPTSPMAKEADPRAVFDRMFGNRKEDQEKASRAKRDRYNKSILDFVSEDAGDLRRKLGVHDQKKLDEYLYAVRQIERRINTEDKLRGGEDETPDYPRPEGVPREYEDHVKVMFDLMTLAIQTDSTRIITFMYANAGSNRSYRNVGVSDGHHGLSHHGNNRDKTTKISKINQFHVTLFNYFVEKLISTKENGQPLLDNCMVMYGSGIGDGNRHNHHDLPIMLMGKGGGLKAGQHLQHRRETPLTNLYVSMLRRMGAPASKFGDSNGELQGLG